MKQYISLSFFSVLLLLAGAGAATAQKADRGQYPKPGPVESLELPEVQTFKLASGLPVYLVEKRDIPIVQFELAFHAGSVYDPPAKLGLARMTAEMLDEGAGPRDALALSEEIDFLGIELGAAAGAEKFSVRLFSPTARLGEALPLLADVVLRPRFEEADLERKRTEALVRLAQAHDESRIIASTAFGQLVFGKDHPYGRPGGGDEASLRALTPDDLRGFRQEYLTPANGYLVIVGDLTADEARERLEALFGDWSGGRPHSMTIPAAPKQKGMQIFLIDKPGAAQSELRFGHAGVGRNTPDYYPIQVLNTILGGSFTSRLNQNIREEHGYAYGAGSTFYQPRGQGYFLASSAVQTDVTDKAIQEFMKELRGIRTVTEADVEKARNYEALGFPDEFTSVERIAGNVSDVVFYELAPDFLNRHMGNLLAVPQSEVARAARTYVDPQNMVLVVVGDRGKIEAGIRALKLGKITILRTEDVLGPVPKVDTQP